MTIATNINLIKEIEEKLSEILPIKLGVNKRNELVRLAYEVSRAEKLSLEEVLQRIEIDELISDGKSGIFHKVKERLLAIRYPSGSEGGRVHIMPFKARGTGQECQTWQFKLDPKHIFIEEEVKSSEWTKSFIKNFPKAEVHYIGESKEVFGELASKDPIDIYNARRENVFLIKNKHLFVKVCPCTKEAKRCGYWILNIGFGCPVDCSYCYLQMYSNAPGMVLPANIEDYYAYIKELDGKVKTRTRIGTGEFTDSLAFDEYTGYSRHLIEFFKDMKNLVLELKTKVAGIDNIIKAEPNDNVVVSWSINTRGVASKYEQGAATISERIDAALRAAERGYKIGFHFDPIVYYEGWEEEYKSIVKEMFSKRLIREKTAWISLGTLRYTPGLKQVAESRFEDNLMFYSGEFFEDTDGKLRYTRKLRIEMYNKMIEWIRSSGTNSWIYLCMEPEDLWRETILDEKDYSFYQTQGGIDV